MAAPPPASDKTIKDTTKTVVDANASVEAAAQGTTAAVKTGVDATKKVVEQVGNVAGALGNVATIIADSNKSLITAAGKTTTSVEKVTSGIEKTATQTADAIEGLGKKITAPVINVTPPAGLKDISKSLAKAVGKIAFDKTLGKLPNSIKSIGSTIGGAVMHPTKTLAKMGEGVLGKLNSWGGLGDIGSSITFADTPPEGAAKEEGGEKDEEKSQLAETSNGLLGQLVEVFWDVRDIQANMLNMMVDDSAAASEAAAEAARRNLGKGDGGIKDAKVQEAKAGGFFSRMGGAIMNPMKAMGSGMKKIGKGIQGILTGIARGLMAFANPLVLVGVTFMALSLPILAAGLAAAFKVFDMIAGQGSAMDILTGIIESLGKAIGGILKDVLHGLGLFIGASGPFIEQFFLGISHIMRALAPIISALVPLFQTLITSIESILTSKAFNETLQVIVKEIGNIVLAIIDLAKVLAPVLEVLFNNIGMIVTVIGNVILGIVNAIAAIIKTVGDVIIAVIENIGVVIDSVGNAVSKVIDSIGGVWKVVGDVIVAVIDSIGNTIVKVIDSIVSGIERLANVDGKGLLVTAASLLVLGAALAVFGVGAMVAGMAMPSKEDLESMANSISKFGAIDASNFGMVGAGITKIGEGLMSFGGGSFIAGLADAFGKWIGATDPVEKFQKFAKIGPGLDLAAKGIDGLGEAMKRFEKTMKALDLSKVDEVAEGMAKIRDASDPGALSKLGGMVSSVAGAATAIWGGDKKEAVEAGADAHSIPTMIARTNLLLEQGFITGPSGLFGSPSIATSAFAMSRQQKKQIKTAEDQLKTAEETKDEIKSPVKINARTGKPMPVKEIKSPVLTEIKIPEPKKFVYEPMKLATPDAADFGGGTTYRQKSLEEGGGFEEVRVGRTMKRVPVEPLDTTAVTPAYPPGQLPPGQALMAGQMESNALATESSGTSSITDASSSTIVNNSNQSMMMPESDPNPHNMDFRPEERLFPS